METCGKFNDKTSSDSKSSMLCDNIEKRINGFVTYAPELAYQGGGFKPEYFEKLSTLEADNFWFQVRNQIIIWALDKYKPNPRSFLEIGCGTGFVLSGIAKSFPKTELMGSEIFIDGLTHCAKRLPKATLVQMDARDIPFEKEFEVIGAFDVLEHIEEDEVVLKEIYNALTPQGICLLTIPQHPSLWSASDDYAHHVRRYTKKEIEAKAKQAGFSILRSSSFVTSLLPAMIISRYFSLKNNSNFNPESELRIPFYLNKTFSVMMKFDLLGIKLGLNYPVGGSRLLVLKK